MGLNPSTGPILALLGIPTRRPLNAEIGCLSTKLVGVDYPILQQLGKCVSQVYVEPNTAKNRYTR